MTFNNAPLRSSFGPSSWSSSLGVAEAFASYRRSQVIIAGQSVASQQAVGADEEEERFDEEASIAASNPPEDDYEDAAAIVGSLPWDEEISTSYRTPRSRTVDHFASVPSSSPWLAGGRVSASVTKAGTIGKDHSIATDRTPLLGAATSPPAAHSVRIYPEDHATSPDQHAQYADDEPASRTFQEQSARHHKNLSISSVQSEKKAVAGTSTFGQTLFNSTAILLGFGLLSEPLAFAYSGWIGATILLISLSLVTCYTAKILARIMLEDPQMHTYADIAIKAFGKRSRLLTSSVFCLELFSVCVILVTLFGDSFRSIWPAYSTTTYKFVALAIFIPTSFVPMSLLSCGSIVGILSTLLIVTVLLVDGISKPEAPGSLWNPAETSMGFRSWKELGAAFGLFMAGLSGHAVLPSLARDMADPTEFSKMINWSFTGATVIYALVGACGYLMFGNNVSDEFSRELISTPGYNVLLNKIAVWSLVVMPITKLALSARPVNIAIEIALGLYEDTFQERVDEPVTMGVNPARYTKHFQLLKHSMIFAERVLFACLVVGTSILIPQFSQMMAFLGSFNAFLLCVIGPISAKMALEGKWNWIDGFLLISGIVMATWGTYVAFLVT